MRELSALMVNCCFKIELPVGVFAGLDRSKKLVNAIKNKYKMELLMVFVISFVQADCMKSD